MDGLDNYGSEYLRIRFQSVVLEKVARLEKNAQHLFQQDLSRTSFMEKNALLVGRFMLGVQNLLAVTSEEKNDFVPWTNCLSNKDFAILLWEFYQASTDFDKIQILSQCLDDWKAGHPYLSPAALRSVSALARLLDPAGWGYTTWRTLGCLGFESMTELKKLRLHSTPAFIQQEFAQLRVQDVVNATRRMRQLISEDLPTAASVAAALHCISLDIWQFESPFERQDPLAVMPDPAWSSIVLG